MKQYILYLNLPDSYCQIFLPTENNRKYELDLSAQLPIPACKMELEPVSYTHLTLPTN